MDLRPLATQVERQLTKSGSKSASPLPGLYLLRHDAPTDFEATVYNPIICLILQGEKETAAADRTVTVAKGQCVLVSHDLPVIARITKATRACPYLALVISLDLSILRSLYDEVGDASLAIEGARVLEARAVDEHVAQVIKRYIDLLDDPVGARVLGPLIVKELHFRLLMSDAGAMLRCLLHRHSHASQLVAALRVLREQFRDELEVGRLARLAGMSTSSFHKHFKSVMETTPLQYQKDLRLTEARRLLRGGEHSVSTTAFEVGYNSPSQFSREYARKFGAPPQLDLGHRAQDRVQTLAGQSRERAGGAEVRRQA